LPYGSLPNAYRSYKTKGCGGGEACGGGKAHGSLSLCGEVAPRNDTSRYEWHVKLINYSCSTSSIDYGMAKKALPEAAERAAVSKCGAGGFRYGAFTPHHPRELSLVGYAQVER